MGRFRGVKPCRTGQLTDRAASSDADSVWSLCGFTRILSWMTQGLAVLPMTSWVTLGK